MCLSMLCVLLATLPAAAAKPVAVGVFEGPFAEETRSKAVKAINQQGALRVVKDKPSERVSINQPPSAYQDNAADLHVAGIVVGRVSNKNDAWAVLLAVYAPNGELVQKFRMRGASADAMNKKVAALLPDHLEKLLSDFEPPPRRKAKPKPPPKRKAKPKPPPKRKAEKKPPPPPKRKAEKKPPPPKDQEKPEQAKAEEKPKQEPEASGDASEDESMLAMDADDDNQSASGDLPSPLELWLTAGYSRRNFSYLTGDDSTENMPMENDGAMWANTVRIYPGALFVGGVLGNLGLELGIEHGYPRDLDTLGLSFRTEASQFFIGPRARIPFGNHQVGIVAGYGTHVYRLIGDEVPLDRYPDEGDGMVEPCEFNAGPGEERTDIPSEGSCFVPDVEYELLRAGLDSRFQFGGFLLGARAGYRIVLGAGEIEESYWFGGVSGGAFELGLLFGYVLHPGVSGLIGFDYTGYSLSFDEPTDERLMDRNGPLADGASDAYIQAWAGVIVEVPGL